MSILQILAHPSRCKCCCPTFSNSPVGINLDCSLIAPIIIRCSRNLKNIHSPEKGGEQNSAAESPRFGPVFRTKFNFWRGNAKPSMGIAVILRDNTVGS